MTITRQVIEAKAQSEFDSSVCQFIHKHQNDILMMEKGYVFLCITGYKDRMLNEVQCLKSTYNPHNCLDANIKGGMSAMKVWQENDFVTHIETRLETRLDEN